MNITCDNKTLSTRNHHWWGTLRSQDWSYWTMTERLASRPFITNKINRNPWRLDYESYS